jgi:hypothetical protein
VTFPRQRLLDLQRQNMSEPLVLDVIDGVALNMSKQFIFGQPVQFHVTLRRVFVPRAPRSRREWQRQGHELWLPQPPVTRHGVVIGKRVLRNGTVEYGSYEEPTVFYGDESITAYLVAENMRSAPVYVLPEDLEASDE